jgi:hypothetical protein
VTVQQVANVPAAVTVVTTAETIAIQLPQLAEQIPAGEGLLIHGFINWTGGVTATTVVIRVRQGNTVGGTLVGTADTHTTASGAPQSIPFAAVFTGLAAPYGNQFCVTVTQPAATTNGAVNDGVAFLDAISPGG